MNLLDIIKENAKQQLKRIVLPEGEEERTLKAADIILQNGYAEIILIGNPLKIRELANLHKLENIDKASIVDPQNIEKEDAYTDLMVELRSHKGMTKEKARGLIKDPLFLATLMIKKW